MILLLQNESYYVNKIQQKFLALVGIFNSWKPLTIVGIFNSRGTPPQSVKSYNVFYSFFYLFSNSNKTFQTFVLTINSYYDRIYTDSKKGMIRMNMNRRMTVAKELRETKKTIDNMTAAEFAEYEKELLADNKQQLKKQLTEKKAKSDAEFEKFMTEYNKLKESFKIEYKRLFLHQSIRECYEYKDKFMKVLIKKFPEYTTRISWDIPKTCDEIEINC